MGFQSCDGWPQPVTQSPVLCQQTAEGAMEFLFGEEQCGLAMGFLRSLVHGFGSKRLAAANRLAVVDAAAVDGQRRLVLIRRDNVEHLLMIGGRADIVVEPNIVRAAAREPALARPPAFAEATEHPAATQNEGMWPPRPQRQSPAAEESAPQHTEAEPPVPIAPRQSRPVDKLASDQPPREMAPRSAREPHPPGAAAEAVFTPAAEHNSAEAAQRLVEAVLLRSRRKP